MGKHLEPLQQHFPRTKLFAQEHFPLSVLGVGSFAIDGDGRFI